MLDFNPRVAHPVHNAVGPIAPWQAVVARCIIGSVGHQRDVAHRRSAKRFRGGVHVALLEVVAFRIVHKAAAWWVAGMGQRRVLKTKPMLSRTLPPLVALKRILRVERRHHAPHLHQASENVETIVGRRQQFNVFHHRTRTAGSELKQVRLVAIAALVPSQVGAPMANRQVSQDSRRSVGVLVAAVHVTLLSRHVDHTFQEVLTRPHTSREGRRIGEGKIEVQRVGLSAAAQGQTTPHAPHIQPH